MNPDLWFLPFKMMMDFWGIDPEKKDMSQSSVVARQLQHNDLLLQDALHRFAATFVATCPSL